MKALNSLFLFGFFAMFIYYFYLKTKQFHTSRVFPIRKKMYKSLAGIPLGLLLVFFALNQLVLFDGIVTYLVAALFIIVGVVTAVYNYNAFQHYKQFVDEEADLNKDLYEEALKKAKKRGWDKT